MAHIDDKKNMKKESHAPHAQPSGPTPPQGAAGSETEDEAVDLETLAAAAKDQPKGAGGAADRSPSPKGSSDKGEASVAPVAAAAAPQESPKGPTPEQQIAELKEKADGLQDKYLRLMAEFDNYKRRSLKEYEQLREQATERLMTDMVEVKDNLDRALQAGKERTDYDTFFKGTQLIDDKLMSVLQKHGLSSFGAPGDQFNPEIHDALMKQPHEEIQEDHVVQVVDRGYKLKGKVIRHARVIVSGGNPQLPVEVPQTSEEPAAGDQVGDSGEATFEPKA
jgi:molecular chaperone GrpE